MDWERWRSDPLRLWIASAVSFVIVVSAAALVFPRQVYDEFIWRYFWGPVVADAYGAGTSGCAIREDGSVTIETSAQVCQATTGIAASPGYTTVSTVSYALILLFALIGVYLLLDRAALLRTNSEFYMLIPFVFFGGSLRVVEDANTVLYGATGDLLIGMPIAGFLISPLIYFLVFGITVLVMVSSLLAKRAGLVERYEYPVAAAGSIFLIGTIGVLLYFVFATEIGSINLGVPTITLGGATLITVLVWWGTERFSPSVNEATGLMGAVIVWGHTVDGVANVLSVDWGHLIGLDRSYGPKHVINRGIINTMETVQPAAVTDAIGTAWPFLPLKVVVAVIVVALFNDEVFEDSPSFSMLLLVAILAVGLGPGTRDFLRATMGI